MTVAVNTDQIPDREENQDEAVVLLVLRRTDPDNPTGGASPDLAGAFETASAGFNAFVTSFCAEVGFDPAQSYVTVAGLTDVEQGAAITVEGLAAITEEPPVEEEPPPAAPPV